ncbi:MAG: ATP-binding protein [Leadbetterella sp.]|nr:ATP-binding protein [Leadbetterella sp.]
MNSIKVVVLTGGPCSGKSTVLRALQDEFGEQLVVVREVATVLLEGGFPLPGKDLDWSEDWQSALQSAIVPLQVSFEQSHTLIAKHRQVKLLVCDRGLLDGAAYTPGGTAEFCKRYGIIETEAYSRYKTVIHLESLAHSNPELYGKAGNEARFESVERAQELEQATRTAWQKHPHRIIIEGKRGVEEKIAETIGIVRDLLA